MVYLFDGESVNVTVDNNLTTVIGQEVYPFTLANNIVTNPNFLFQGIQDVVGVLDVACAWGVNAAMKPMLIPKIWSEFQAYLRSYNTGMQTYPTIWSQYGGGSGTAAGGSIYVWPLPSQASQMDWDCWCRPVLLTSPGTPEVIPYSWTTPVCYYAAYLAYSAAQRPEDAQRMHEDYKEKMLEAQAIATAPFVDNYYESDF